METRFHRLCVCFQVILAYESIVLCMCSGKYIDIYFIMKITYQFNQKKKKKSRGRLVCCLEGWGSFTVSEAGLF